MRPTWCSRREAESHGSDGCNRVAGTYQLKHTVVTFSEMATTRMACIDAGGIDVAFRDALKSARRLAVAGDRLDLVDSANKRVAVFVAVSAGGSTKRRP